MKLETIERTPNSNKEFKAVYKLDNGSSKTIRFGTKSNFVTNNDKTELDKTNYIKRHQVRENHNDPLTAGALSRHLLWGDSRSIKKNVKDFKTRFNV
jgi:hypothetical protein